MSKPSIGKTGTSNNQPGGTKGSMKEDTSTHGGQHPFLPKSYEGARPATGNAGQTASTDRADSNIPFLPAKPE